jgi:hypothetical protein
MVIESTGRSKHERPRIGGGRPQKVIRLHALPQYLGVTRTAIDLMVRRGQLHPFSCTGMRSKVVTEDEVLALQERAKARSKAEPVLDDDETEADETETGPRQRLLRSRQERPITDD